MQPGTVASLRVPSWRANAVSPASGVRLTVLLDASPINPYASKLRAWDRAFLLDSLSSLLSEVPSGSVHIIAFNLDQQREIFRQEQLDRFTFTKLSEALRDLELGTVSYQTIKHQQGWAELLARLLAGEMAAKPPADHCVPWADHAFVSKNASGDAGNDRPVTAPKIFYFEYFPRRGAEYPDAIHHLTSAFKGRVFKLHSPGELAENIRKMQKDLQQ